MVIKRELQPHNFLEIECKITQNQRVVQKNQGIFNEFNQLLFSWLNFIGVHLHFLCTVQVLYFTFILSLLSCIWQQTHRRPCQVPFYL